MSLSDLGDGTLKLILFGGKGGVGKTTCASSTGLYMAEHFKTLLFSTDPAHSLSDSLGIGVGDEVKEVNGIKNLSALEVSAEKSFSEFKIEYEGQLKKILDTSTYFDQEDIESILALPIPGLDEVMGFKTIVDLIEEAKFDKYIVDTAPTGHALRLLSFPNMLDSWIKILARVRWKYRYVVETFAGKYNPDEGDDFLLGMKKTVKRIETLLRNSSQCEFIAVTIPEEMAILETERLLLSLRNYGIRVRRLIVNNVIESGNCEFCQERKKAQEKCIDKIRNKFSDLDLSVMPLYAQAVKGIDTLDGFKNLLFQFS